MPRTVKVLIFIVAVLATVSFASTASTTRGSGPSTVAQWTTAPGPTSGSLVAGNAGPTTIHWDKFYDRLGNLLPGDPSDAVGFDSLYWKDYSSTTYLKSSAKVQNPSPADRTAMSFHDADATTCTDPTGDYVYEVNGTSLYRFSTADGSMTTYTLAYTGGLGCATDGQYIYRPSGATMYKYTMTGVYVNSTTTNYSCDAYSMSCCRDTVWFTGNRYSGVNLYGYACSRFAGGSISNDATWNVGTGTNGVGNVAWDGTYYYVPWIGTSDITFKRFYADRTLYSTGTVSIDPRSVMCYVLHKRQVTRDSLYWKLFTSTTNLYSSSKAQDVTAVDPTSFPWQYSQSVPCMTPDGHYTFEVVGTNMRRTDLWTGVSDNYALADASGGACGTDGQHVYVPNGTTTRKYSLTGALVSATTTDFAPATGVSTFCFGVANDTVWISPALAGATWYGYACSKFNGGSITYDATWATSGVSNSAMTVTYDGQYYYMVWGGGGSNMFLRFYRDRTLYSTGTVTGDARSVMCKQGDYGVMICHGASYSDDVASLAQMLADSSGGKFAAVDTYYIGNGGGGGHATFPATYWYGLGYRAILAFTDAWPEDPVALGDSLARFVQLGGGVVDATFSDCSPYHITGNWRSMYAPFTVTSASDNPGTMGTVHQPVHPVMSGVTDLYVGNFRSSNTHSSLRSASCACLSEYTDANRCLAASFDSAGQRAVSLGMYPLDYWISSASGDWCRLFVNALDWTAVGPSVGVTAPNGGEDWTVGTVHNITWSQTGNAVRDSIYYSTDAGSNWSDVAYYDVPPVPLQHAWTVPGTPTTEARVKVVTWNADGGRVEDVSDSNFTIEPFVGIAQPENNALPLAFVLYQSYPNPLASGAVIRYALPRPAQVELRIYDVAGALVRRLVDGAQTAGYRRAYWNACDDRGRYVAPGVYYCRFRAGDFTATQKLVVRR
jgi:hypothetical protein